VAHWRSHAFLPVLNHVTSTYRTARKLNQGVRSFSHQLLCLYVLSPLLLCGRRLPRAIPRSRYTAAVAPPPSPVVWRVLNLVDLIKSLEAAVLHNYWTCETVAPGCSAGNCSMSFAMLTLSTFTETAKTWWHAGHGCRRELLYLTYLLIGTRLARAAIICAEPCTRFPPR
jgi:hypothetical protein